MITSMRKRIGQRVRHVTKATDAPPFRVDSSAVEYRGTEEGQPMENTMTSADPSTPPLLKLDCLQPLPRCPQCGTAVGFGQGRCHGCDRRLRGV